MTPKEKGKIDYGLEKPTFNSNNPQKVNANNPQLHYNNNVISNDYRVNSWNANYSDIKKQLASSTSPHRRLLSKFDEGDCATYDLETGEVVNLTEGYCVSFCTTLDNYSDAEIEDIISELKEMTGSKVYAGCYGRPEFSFCCKNIDIAREIMYRFHQDSIYNVVEDKCEYNPNREDVKKFNPQNNIGGK